MNKKELSNRIRYEFGFQFEMKVHGIFTDSLLGSDTRNKIDGYLEDPLVDNLRDLIRNQVFNQLREDFHGQLIEQT